MPLKREADGPYRSRNGNGSGGNYFREEQHESRIALGSHFPAASSFLFRNARLKIKASDNGWGSARRARARAGLVRQAALVTYPTVGGSAHVQRASLGATGGRRPEGTGKRSLPGVPWSGGLGHMVTVATSLEQLREQEGTLKRWMIFLEPTARLHTNKQHSLLPFSRIG